MVKKAQHERPLAQNRKASHDYYILDTIEAGSNRCEQDASI